MTRQNPEYRLQKTVIQHLMFRALPGVIYFHCPNGNKLAPRTAAHNKAMGVKAGVADLIIIIKGRAFFLELKAEKGRQSESQRLFEQECIEAGCQYAIAHNVSSALHCLETWGAIKPDRTRANAADTESQEHPSRASGSPSTYSKRAA